jgi:DsbC/DsbD-like thiol-disulfide interchange protein
MRFLRLLSLIFISSLSLSAQEHNPVFWTCSYKAISATEGEITILAKIEPGWHTYSQRPTEAGPISTTIQFTPSKQYDLAGKTEETNVYEEYDKAFEAKLFMFSDKAEFKQKIKLKSGPGFSISIKVEYVSCSDKMCLPPKTIELNVKAQ